jgi:hypothetical protein
MVRLRRLHQAQDVTLVSSELPDDTAAADGAAHVEEEGEAAAPTTAVDGCGETRGRPNYEFEVKVVLAPVPADQPGGEEVPASLGGGA